MKKHGSNRLNKEFYAEAFSPLYYSEYLASGGTEKEDALNKGFADTPGGNG